MPISDNINRLVKHPSKQVQLPDQKQPDSISKKLGAADFPSDDSAGAGIASPLTESSRVTEMLTQYDDFNVWSVDIEFIKQLNMTDTVGRPVVFNLTIPEVT
ncbi:MAG: hypothetical protein GQ532_14575 [Methylomarinum sp.]|nr:hypothetical protein [Methylomarinum sp.]